MDEQRTCICIDLKSYYASVECVARGLDPLKARLLRAGKALPTDKKFLGSLLDSNFDKTLLALPVLLVVCVFTIF